MNLTASDSLSVCVFSWKVSCRYENLSPPDSHMVLRRDGPGGEGEGSVGLQSVNLFPTMAYLCTSS